MVESDHYRLEVPAYLGQLGLGGSCSPLRRHLLYVPIGPLHLERKVLLAQVIVVINRLVRIVLFHHIILVNLLNFSVLAL